MIKERYEEAVKFHGHRCPGLAIGVRAAEEARRQLGAEAGQDTDIVCVAESMACYIDGIQSLLGCTFGNGRLLYRPTGKCAFSFFDKVSGESLRLVMGKLPRDIRGEEKIDFILTAPLEQLFTAGKPRRPLPEKGKKVPGQLCAGCGEWTDGDMLREKDGRVLCPDCAEAI